MPRIFKTESAKATLPRSPLAGFGKPATWGRPDSAATGTQKPKFFKRKKQEKVRKDAPQERRGGDSNPRRRGYRRNGFRDRRIQPLCHLSAAECIHCASPLQPHRDLRDRTASS